MKKHTNGVVPVPTVVASPGAERSEAERSEVERSAAPGEATTAPDPEVVPKAQRRQFSADYKKRILAEAEAAQQPGVIGALLRREGLYSSHLTHWRQQSQEAMRNALAPHRRGPKPKHDPLFEEVRQLKQENSRLTDRLARAELIIDVQKKVSQLLGIPMQAANNDGSNS